jgi:hypothetical protein
LTKMPDERWEITRIPFPFGVCTFGITKCPFLGTAWETSFCWK